METIVKYAYEVYKKGNFTTAYFAKEAEAAGYCATVESVTKGGASIYQYADAESTIGKMLRQQTEGRHYDFAVIQDQSLSPIINEERFLGGSQRRDEADRRGPFCSLCHLGQKYRQQKA